MAMSFSSEYLGNYSGTLPENKKRSGQLCSVAHQHLLSSSTGSNDGMDDDFMGNLECTKPVHFLETTETSRPDPWYRDGLATSLSLRFYYYWAVMLRFFVFTWVLAIFHPQVFCLRMTCCYQSVWMGIPYLIWCLYDLLSLFSHYLLVFPSQVFNKILYLWYQKKKYSPYYLNFYWPD